MKDTTTTKDLTITEKLTAHIIAECSQINMEKRYDEMLDECTEGCDFCKQFGASRILKEMDPIAYPCGFSDFTDSQRDEVCEIGDYYYDRREAEKAKEEFIDDLNSELSDLETELEETDEDDVADRAKLEQAINEKQAEIEEAEKFEL